MEFYIEKDGSTPVVNQIQDQIKLAVAMGVFRDGDTLPSIRDVEKQTGINRNQIHKAYLALRQSGLLVLTRGKGTVIAKSVSSSQAMNIKYKQLAGELISKARRAGISPTSFVRYLNRHVQETERKAPSVVYVDTHREIAARVADDISRLWRIPVTGISFSDLKSGSNGRRKILVNQFMYEDALAILRGRKSAVIPIEVRSSDQTVKTLSKIKPGSSVLYIHLPQPSHRLRFIVSHLREQMDSRGIKLADAGVRDMRDFRELMNGARHDYYLVGPAVRGEVPPEMRRDPRILQIHPQLDPASLEVARIRAGVII